MNTPNAKIPLIEVFGTLRAEGEPWLFSVYVPPAHPAALTLARSTLILGGAGSGKSSFLLWMAHKAREQAYLPVFWRWDPLSWIGEAALETQRHLLSTLSSTIASALFIELGKNQNLWENLLSTTRQWLLYFFAKRLDPDGEGFMAIPPDCEPFVADLWDSIQKVSLPPWMQSLSHLGELGYLTPLLSRMGWRGLLVLIEDIAASLNLVPEMRAVCNDFFAFLALFDIPNLYFKIVLDQAFADLVESSPVVLRRRADLYRLQWSEAALETIVNRRLQTVLGEHATLDRLYDRTALVRWFTIVGGLTPRGWLEALGALLLELQDKTALSPFHRLTPEAWRDFRRRHMPGLFYNAQEASVTVGWRKTFLSPGEDALFRYLWERRGQICPRAALYKAYCQQIYGEQSVSECRTFPNDYRSLLDTAFHRLREAIEPDPEDPMLIVTYRNKGICLEAPPR